MYPHKLTTFEFDGTQCTNDRDEDRNSKEGMKSKCTKNNKSGIYDSFEKSTQLGSNGKIN